MQKPIELTGGVYLPRVRTDLLKRTRNTSSQAQKSGHARWKNVAGAFEIIDNSPTAILLIDDVITTGATIAAAGKALSPIAKQLFVASVALTRSH